VLIEQEGNGKFRLEVLKDDGTLIKIAKRKDQKVIQEAAEEVSSFLKIPLK
jgi:hypothetical protein